MDPFDVQTLYLVRALVDDWNPIEALRLLLYRGYSDREAQAMVADCCGGRRVAAMAVLHLYLELRAQSQGKPPTPGANTRFFERIERSRASLNGETPASDDYGRARRDGGSHRSMDNVRSLLVWLTTAPRGTQISGTAMQQLYRQAPCTPRSLLYPEGTRIEVSKKIVLAPDNSLNKKGYSYTGAQVRRITFRGRTATWSQRASEEHWTCEATR